MGWAQACDVGADAGRYLGFVLGPMAAEAAWAEPVRKYKEAVPPCAPVGQGMSMTTRARSVHALPKLLFVARPDRCLGTWSGVGPIPGRPQPPSASRAPPRRLLLTTTWAVPRGRSQLNAGRGLSAGCRHRRRRSSGKAFGAGPAPPHWQRQQTLRVRTRSNRVEAGLLDHNGRHLPQFADIGNTLCLRTRPPTWSRIFNTVLTNAPTNID